MKTNLRTSPIILAVLMLLSMLLSACGGGGVSAATQPAPVIDKSGVTDEGKVVPKQFTVLAFSANGEVSEVGAVEGAKAVKGVPLARLGKREPLQAALVSAKLEKLSAQQALDTLNKKADLARAQADLDLVAAQKALTEAQKAFNDVDTDDFRKKLDDKEIALQKAKDKLKDTKETLDKYLDLDKDNQTRKDAQNAFDTAQREYNTALYDRDLIKNQQDVAGSNLNAAKARLADAQRTMDAHKTGPDPDDLALAQARFDTAYAQVAAAQRALDNMDLLAPYDGTVVDTSDLVVGQWVTAAKPFITFADFSEWYVETKDLTELEVVSLFKGQKASLTLDALPGVTLTGVVDAINDGYTEKSGDILYTVRVRLNSTTETRLRWGMTAKITFEK